MNNFSRKELLGMAVLAGVSGYLWFQFTAVMAVGAVIALTFNYAAHAKG
jgi:preprotein translocase subunit SecF